VSSPNRKRRPGPVGGKRDLNRQEMQRTLAKAALELFLATCTEAVTIDQIVDRAGMAKGSFYRYARDKADLVEQIVAPVADEVVAALARCEAALRHGHRDTLAAIYLQLANDLAVIVAHHTPVVRLYLQEVRAPAGPVRRAIHALSDRLTDRTIALTEIARDHRLIRDVDPEISALVVLGAVEALLASSLRRRRVPAATIPDVIAQLVAIVLRGIRPDVPA
jgi:AcrR family transcriptional regulator